MQVSSKMVSKLSSVSSLISKIKLWIFQKKQEKKDYYYLFFFSTSNSTLTLLTTSLSMSKMAPSDSSLFFLSWVKALFTLSNSYLMLFMIWESDSSLSWAPCLMESLILGRSISNYWCKFSISSFLVLLSKLISVFNTDILSSNPLTNLFSVSLLCCF